MFNILHDKLWPNKNNFLILVLVLTIKAVYEQLSHSQGHLTMS